ncbi:uncharacterized protein [Miscanthus floridulus]|uniref:uncharacterized protein n=1 Tax=Miscanthus floridulus TaxID=154761 RepID=UPI0034594690
MASLAPKLGDLLMAEYVVQKGLKPDIESLSRELVRELSYDMEDTVDDFILRVADGGKQSATATDANVFKKILGKLTAVVKKVKHRREISDKIEDIKKLSNELAMNFV